MASSSNTYRQYIPEIGLSIERNTASVPKDGKYYLVRDGQIVKAFTTLRKAQVAFRKALAEVGYTPTPPEKEEKSAAERSTEAYLDAKDLYWAETHKYRGRGGRGGRGGV